MCERQHKSSRGSLLPTREDTDGVLRIPLWNPRLPISVLELTKPKVVEGELSLPNHEKVERHYKVCNRHLVPRRMP